MSSIYKTSVNGAFEFSISEDDITKLDIIATEPDKFHLLLENTSYHTQITDSEFGKKNYNVRVNNTNYSVSIKDALDILINDMGFSIGATAHVDSIKAPMPGLILDIPITEGQTVEENDALLVLEAMKMENVITSPRAGTIKSILVTQGQAVDKNALLIEFE